MTVPFPAGLRCDHPCLPVPRVTGRRLEIHDPPARARQVGREVDKLRIAAQLLALTSMLAELELWPGRHALRQAVVVESGSVVRAAIRSFPKPLAAVARRIGGGEVGASRLRAAALEAIGQAAGLPADRLPEPSLDPGPFLHPELARVLEWLPQPLDAATARSLWMVSLPSLRLPREGEVVLRQVADARIAARLAAAAWSALERERRRCWVWRVGEDGATGPLPTQGGSGVLLVTGVVGSQELRGAERWAARAGCGSLVVGRFPRGWSPPGPDAGSDSWQLLVAGISREQARQESTRWSSRLVPWDGSTAEILTERARTRFKGRGATRPPSIQGSDLPGATRILSLLPDGLPDGFMTLHAPDLLARLRGGRVPGAVRKDGRWRLLDPQPLGRDALHREVAGLFAPDDPRRLRHLALAADQPSELVAWLDDRLQALEPAAVGEVLGPLAPGALGEEVELARAEACLWRHDLTGARCALQSVPTPRRAPFDLWISAIDTVAGGPIARPEARFADLAPRAVAVVAAIALLRAVRRGDPGTAGVARGCLDALAGRLSPSVRHWTEVLATVADRPSRLTDRRWRQEVVGGHGLVMRELLHRVGLLRVVEGRSRSGLRCLRRALSLTEEPGLRGGLEQDLGRAAADLGRTSEAELHYQRAFVLLEAAGFRDLPSTPLGNLASSDLDQLRLEQAAGRLRELAERHDDPFTRAELARLELARGDLEGAWQALARLPTPERAGSGNLLEAVHFLHGVRFLLDGTDPRAARHFLTRGGDEGRTWLGLHDAVRGRNPRADEEDGWGVSLAARWIATGAPLTASGEQLDDSDPRLGMAAALTQQVAPERVPLANPLRRRFAERLQRLGAEGWARVLRGGVTADAGWLAAVARLAEVRSLTALSAEEVTTLIGGLGLSGLELWAEGGRSRLLEIGHGRPGTDARIGPWQVVPLGGELPDDSAWWLVRALLEPAEAMPAVGKPRVEEPDVAATGIHGRSAAMDALRAEISHLAPMRVTVLLLGETGVGKDVAARALHRRSGRRGRFVPVNVAAIPETLLESELFGSVRGAFTGADRDRKGLVDTAEGGTLFLDEIGDLGPTLQAKLLRFLETFEVRPVGAERSRLVDVRVVAATHHHLEERAREGSFRSDLYYRIAAAPVTIPPLRERREDILELRDLFQDQLEDREGLPRLPWAPEAEGMLLRHHWPGNVRELRHVVETSRIRATGRIVGVDDLAIRIGAQAAVSRRWDEALDGFRRDLLREALSRNSGNRSATARELGISRQALLYHLRSLGLAGTRGGVTGGKKEADRSARWRKEEV